MEIACTNTEMLLFERISETAARMQVEVFVIGGFVRDKMIGRPTSDADIVCVGNAIELANEVAGIYDPRPAVSFFKNFGTAHFKIRKMTADAGCGICRGAEGKLPARLPQTGCRGGYTGR
jgi:tRNA nucleotidyltransferase/poly(A) polymerase